MATRFSKTQALKLQAKEKRAEAEKERWKYIEGAQLPLVGLLVALVGMACATTGFIFLMLEVSVASPDMQRFLSGLAGCVVGLFLLFFAFGRWARL